MKNQWSHSVKMAVFCAVAGALGGIASEKKPETTITEQFLPPIPQDKAWRLTWSDEFNGTKIDQSKWEVLGDWKRRDGYWVKEDAYLDSKGNLIIRTKKAGDRYTSGAVRTKGKFDHKFGYWVCRSKFPTQQGHWPAFWLHIGTVNKVGNQGRDGTEIDIMEKPWREDKITQNLHWDGYGKDHKSLGTDRIYVEPTKDGWLVAGLLWEPGKFAWYCSGRKVGHWASERIPDVPLFLKLTMQMGGWGGNRIVDGELPDVFRVDYVRAWQRANLVGPGTR